jgi:hypothetical protein
MNSHPKDADLALLAGGDCGRVTRFLVAKHVRGCRECTAKVAHFEMLRADVSRMPAPELDWSRLAAEMKANIRLGIEAGECVRGVERPRRWNPRLAVAFASLTFLIAAGLMMKSSVGLPQQAKEQAANPVLESTGEGLELRNGTSSITLLNRTGSIADQSVNAEGEIRARYVQSGAVTINDVYLQ